MSGTILFVHGMGEKPAREAERQRMWAPITASTWAPIPYSDFDVVYWADLRQSVARATATARTLPRALRALPVRQRASIGWLVGGLRPYLTRPDLLLLNLAERCRRNAQMALGLFTGTFERTLRHSFNWLMRDLAPYFDGTTRGPTLDAVLAQFEAHRSDAPLCVVSHSMGTVVALDAAIAWGGPIDTFVTLGAPLGWEYVKNGLGRPYYPENIRRWFNLYDRFDNATLPDRRLGDDYPDAAGGRRVVDVARARKLRTERRPRPASLVRVPHVARVHRHRLQVLDENARCRCGCARRARGGNCPPRPRGGFEEGLARAAGVSCASKTDNGTSGRVTCGN